MHVIICMRMGCMWVCICAVGGCGYAGMCIMYAYVHVVIHSQMLTWRKLTHVLLFYAFLRSFPSFHIHLSIISYVTPYRHITYRASYYVTYQHIIHTINVLYTQYTIYYIMPCYYKQTIHIPYQHTTPYHNHIILHVISYHMSSHHVSIYHITIYHIISHITCYTRIPYTLSYVTYQHNIPYTIPRHCQHTPYAIHVISAYHAPYHHIPNHATSYTVPCLAHTISLYTILHNIIIVYHIPYNVIYIYRTSYYISICTV